jgi:hypothetical protein
VHDYSAVSTPSDLDPAAADRLDAVVASLAALSASLDAAAAEHPAELRAAAAFLTSLAAGSLPEGYEAALCAAVPRWPRGRVRHAARFPGSELSLASRGERRSPLRVRLGELAGAAVRYRLRSLFNPVPPSYTTPSKRHPPPDNSACRSRVHELLCMQAPPGLSGRDSAAADGSVSSVLNAALRHVHAYWGALPLLRSAAGDPEADMSLPSEGGAPGEALGEERLEEVLADVELAHAALAGARAGRFIEDLLGWTGVDEAIGEYGGWAKAQASARVVAGAGLADIAADEAHFALLGDVPLLRERLARGAAEADARGNAAQRWLNGAWKRHGCGKASAGALRRNPGVAALRAALVEGNAALVYPGLAVPEEESEEEYGE